MLLAPLLLSAALAAPPAPPYWAGERTRFSINYLGMRMGIASITVGQPEDSLVPVSLEARTTGLAGALYDFHEKLLSRIDPGTGLPAHFVLDTNERGRLHYDTTDYDRAAGKAIVIQRGKTTSRDEVAVPPGTVDFVALVFELRRMPLEPGDRRTFSVLSGDEVHEVLTEVMDRETLQTRAGTFAALKIRIPTKFSGTFSEKHPTYLWLSDDARRVVLRITTDFSFGSAAAELLSYTPGGVDGSARSE